MKKFKNKILIPIITSLSTVALVAPLATSVTSKALNNNGSLQSVNDAANAASYVTITYEGESDSTAGWTSTIQGPNKVRVRSGHSFGSAQKPTATHSSGWKFKGWSKEKYTEESRTIITDVEKIDSNIILYPVFEQVGITINGPDEITTSQSATYSVSIEGASSTNITWSSSFKGDGSCSIDSKSGLLESNFAANGTATITATDSISGLSTSKQVKVVQPWFNSDKVWTINASGVHYWFNMDDMCSETATTIKAYKIGNDGTTADTTFNKSEFNHDIYFGENVTYVPDNFGINLTALSNSNVKFQTTSDTEGAFSSTSKCTMIGKCFLQDCSAWFYKLELPSTIRSIDDGFLMGCTAFNNHDEDFALPSNLVNIGSYFMSGCKVFNKSFTIPETVSHVGEHFMADCDAFCSTLTVNTPAENFDVFGSVSYTLTTSDSEAAIYTTGVTIKGKYASGFYDKFAKRTSNPYRYLILNPVDFKTCDWEDVIYWAEMVEDKNKNEQELCDHFLNGTSKINNIDEFAGLTRTVTMNGKIHTIRVLKVEHAEDFIVENGSVTAKKATFTFETVTLLSKSDGNSLCSKQGSNNYNYATSQLKANLTGTATWDGSTNAYTLLTNENSALKDHIKTVQKNYYYYNGSTWAPSTYNDTLFPLTITEMNLTGSTTEGSAYKYWADHTAASDRVKKNAKNSTGYYWTASSNTSNSTQIYGIDSSGNITNRGCAETSISTSFAFCI